MRASTFALCLALPVAAFVACGGGGLTPSDSGPTGTGGVLGTGGGPVGTGGVATTGGSASVGGMGGGNLGGASGGNDSGTGGSDGDGCHPRVHLLIQRSGAMFDYPAPETDFWWDAVAAALDGGGDLLGEFEGQIEFSASVYSRVDAECPVLNEVDAPIGPGDLSDVLEDEAADFLAQREALAVIDAPTGEAVQSAAQVLSGADDAYILLIASGIPDSCTETNLLCTAEDAFAAVQEAHEGGVQTRVLFLDSAEIDGRYPAGLANAGAGLGIEDPGFYCNEAFVYSDTPGDASFEQPADTAGVEEALRDLLTDMAACN